MAKKKLTLATLKKAVGVGEFVEKTISLVGANGEAFEGEILVKRLSHDELKSAIDAWNLDDKSKATVDQHSKATLFVSVFSSPEEKFFPSIQDTGMVNLETISAMMKAVDEVNDFSGKKWISNQKSSGANLSSTESVEEPLKQQSAK